jgi:hypothetical protein
MIMPTCFCRNDPEEKKRSQQHSTFKNVSENHTKSERSGFNRQQQLRRRSKRRSGESEIAEATTGRAARRARGARRSSRARAWSRAKRSLRNLANSATPSRRTTPTAAMRSSPRTWPRRRRGRRRLPTCRRRSKRRATSGRKRRTPFINTTYADAKKAEKAYDSARLMANSAADAVAKATKLDEKALTKANNELAVAQTALKDAQQTAADKLRYANVCGAVNLESHLRTYWNNVATHYKSGSQFLEAKRSTKEGIFASTASLKQDELARLSRIGATASLKADGDKGLANAAAKKPTPTPAPKPAAAAAAPAAAAAAAAPMMNRHQPPLRMLMMSNPLALRLPPAIRLPPLPPPPLPTTIRTTQEHRPVATMTTILAMVVIKIKRNRRRKRNWRKPIRSRSDDIETKQQCRFILVLH